MSEHRQRKPTSNSSASSDKSAEHGKEDEHYHIRSYAPQSPACPPEVLARLGIDENKLVRKMATEGAAHAILAASAGDEYASRAMRSWRMRNLTKLPNLK
jgi:hypothetical protein